MDGLETIMQYGAGAGMLALTLLLMLAAVYVFIQIQAYLADPHRKEYNEAWFAQFDRYIRSRYRDPELAWRANCFHMHFDSNRRQHPG